MIKDFLRLSYANLKHRKLRTLLTIIGIIVGIAAIVSLISVSQGLENYISGQLDQIGSSRIFVMPKTQGFSFELEGLTTKDTEVLEKISEIEWVNPWLISSEEVEFGNEVGFIQSISALPAKDTGKRLSDYQITMEKGRFFSDNEKGSIMIGSIIAHDFFDKEVLLNNQIKIHDKKFRVIGIVNKIGNQEDDSQIYMSMDDARELFSKTDEVTFIELKIKDGLDVNEVADKIQTRLERSRDDDNFDVLTPDQLLSSVGSVLDIVQIVLASIAAISLIVGGVGIANSTYTSVLERIKDIGIMKSIGARNSHILIMFLVESAFIGLVGGFLGVLLGSSIAILIGKIAVNAGFGILKIIIGYKIIVLGIGFAVVVGIISGLVPAYQASKLKPVEALRHD